MNISDDLEQSPALGYKLQLPEWNYFIAPCVSLGTTPVFCKKRLMLDMTDCILIWNYEPLNALVNSFIFFTSFLLSYDLDENGFIQEKDIHEPANWGPDKARHFLSTLSYARYIRFSMNLWNGSYLFNLSYIPYEEMEKTEIFSIIKDFLSNGSKSKYDFPEKDISKVLKAVQELAETDSDSRIRTILAALYILLDREDDAINVYHSMESMDEYDSYNLGTIYLLHQKLDKAREQFNKIERLKESKYQLGMTYLKEKQYDKAARWFEQLVMEYPEEYYIHPEAIAVMPLSELIAQFSLNNLGICRFHLADNTRRATAEALELFHKAAKWDSRSEASINIQLMDYMRNQILIEREKPKKLTRSKHIKYENIIGNSDVMQQVYELIDDATESDISVLILGKPGTGKEEVAKAVHSNSSRKDGPFIPINCAAIPENLMESELFGYEKGAYTGAIANKKGKFELADGGTLFLDEIGEMNPILQAKILRAIQEKRVTRLGGIKEIEVDIRVISATNKDLEHDLEGY